MEFWKEHAGMRLLLIAVFFVIGTAMVIGGWKMTGQLAGLGWMLLGLVFLLAALAIYNSPFGNAKRKK